MKAIHLTAYGNPAQNLKMAEVSEPNSPSANEALVRWSMRRVKSNRKNSSASICLVRMRSASVTLSCFTSAI
jgi:hypothetical protein